MKKLDTRDREKGRLLNWLPKYLLHKCEDPPSHPRCPSHIYTKNQLIQGLVSDWVYTPVKLLEGLWLWRVGSAHSDPSLGATGMYLQHKWLQGLLLHICQLGQVLSLFFRLPKSNQIQSDQQPHTHSVQKPQPEALLPMLFPCPWLKAKTISCSLAMPCYAYRGALQRQGLAIQNRTSQPKQQTHQFQTQG